MICLRENGYSFKLEEKVEKIKKGWVKLGDICNLERGKILTLKEIEKGEFPVIGGGHTPMGYHNEFNKKENKNDCDNY